jgi:UDP-N-acetylglucosamine 2-epimerase
MLRDVIARQNGLGHEIRERINAAGVGHQIDVAKPFLMVVQHPVTTETDNRRHLETTMRAIGALGMQTIWFWPNPDAGTAEMAEAIRHFREHHEAATAKTRFITNVAADEFVAMLKATACLIGNSSAGIKECSFLGTPVVNIGRRQQGRLTADNVVHVEHEVDAIRAAVDRQLRHGRYAASHVYYRPDASEQITNRRERRAARRNDSSTRRPPSASRLVEGSGF